MTIQSSSALLPLAAACVLLGACGSSAPSSAGVPDSGGAGPDSKAATFAALEDQMSAFDGSDQEQENQALLTFVQGRQEFVDSGLDVEGGAVWGRFADGTTLVMANNLIATPPPASFARPPTAAPRLRKALSTPTSTKVVLGASLGTVYENVNEDIAELFQQEIYDRVQPDSTVDALQSLSDVAVLYLNAHGATVPLHKGADPEYTIWTSTVREKDGSTDLKYKADLADGSLTYFMSHKFDDDEASPGGVKRSAETHYAITTAFVQKYWTGRFAQNSVVFINACRSASAAALFFQLAVINAGAGIYFGWTNRVQGGDAALSAAWFFDRALGTNSDKLPQETPPQRPFPLLDVWSEMQTRQRPDKAQTLDSSTNPRTGETAVLTLFTLTAETGLLAPSIELLAVNETAEELGVNGFLGAVPGSILIGDNDLVIKSWSEVGAVCELPRTGANASGPVKVIVNGGAQFSNLAPLTQWHGTATYTLQEAGSLTMTMTFDLFFRGDIHGPREAPGEKVTDRSLAFSSSRASSGTYAFSGSFTDEVSKFTIEWSGSGALTGAPNFDTLASNVSAVASINNGSWQMAILALAANGNHVHTTQQHPDGSVDDQRFDQDGSGVPPFGDGPTFFGDVNAAFGLTGGSRTLQVESSVASGVPATISVEWSAFSPVSAPDSSTTE
jgi:hypothetical protein